MKFLRLLVVLIFLIISGCSKNTGEIISKTPFIIQVSPVAAFSAQGGFTKIGVVSSTEHVTVSSQVAGRITDIIKKVGSKVLVDQLVITMKDIAGNNTFGVKRAEVGLNVAQDALRQQQLALAKSTFDNNIAVQRNTISSQNTKADILAQQEKLRKDIADNTLGLSGSNLSLQLTKVNADLAKAELDYQTKLDSDNQTILNFINSVKLIRTDLGTIFNDTVSISDDLLGVSLAKEHNNDAYEQILGNKDFYAKNKAQEALRKGFTAYDTFKSISQDVNANTMSGLLANYQESIGAISTLLFEVENLLNATEPGSAFTTTLYSSFKGQIDGLQSKASAMGSSINAQLNGINSFFAVYKQNQESLAKGIDSLKAQLELSKRQVQDTEFNIQNGGERQKLGLDTSLKNVELTDLSTQYTADYVAKNNEIALDALQNTIAQAQIAYEEAIFGTAKFNLTSPIQGTITDILVDKGQEIGPGTPLFTIINTNLLQVELDVTVGEKELVVPGQQVTLNQGGIIGKGIVESVSDVADSNFGYKITVVVTEGKFDVGSSIQVVFVGSVGDNIVIPLNAVNVVDNGRGVVQVWKKNQIVPQTIGLGAMAGEYVIVTQGLAIDDFIITSDVSNFDPEKMEIKLKTTN